jgi:PAS domain S-box-containing protein
MIDKYQFLMGGGEMGQLMRSKDWSTSLVGTPDTWPQSLRTTLSIILNSKFPMFLFWGPNLVCFYNDAYRPSLGNKGKHPNMLGSIAADYWKEIWTVIKPLTDHIFAGGEATWSEDQLIPIYRNGKMEDVYWTFSYSPVNDESGKPAGVFVTCNETTDKILTLQNLEDSKSQLEFAIDAARLGTWDYNPVTKKFTANKRLKEWFGLAPDTVIDLQYAIDAIIDKDKSRVVSAIENALDYTSGGSYDVEYSIIQPHTGQEIIVQAKGRAWFNEDKVAYRFNGTLYEVTEQVKARRQAEENEKEFRQLANSLPELVWTTDKNGNQTFASKRWKAFTGLDPYDVSTFEKMVHPDDLQNILNTWTNCLATGSIYKTQVRLKSAAGDYQWFYVHGEPIKGEEGVIEKWVGSFTNFNVQKRAEKKLIKALVQIEESESRFRDVANTVPVLIWMAGPDKIRNFFNSAWLNFTGRTELQEYGGGWAASVYPDDLEKSMLIYTEAFDQQKPYNMQYRLRRHDGEYRWISARGVPRFTSNGNFEGFIGACMDIHEQVIYQQKLKEDEERLNIIIEASELGNWELNLETKEVNYSDRYLEILGHNKGEKLTHQEILKHLHPDDLGIREAAFKVAYETGILHYESRIIWTDGTVHWIEGKGKVFYNDDNEPVKMIGTVQDITEEKNYQQQLKEREEKFRLLADSMPQHIWTADTAGNLNYFNKSVYDYSGLTKAQLNAEGWMQIVHPEEQEKNIDEWQKSVSTGKDFLFEHRFRRYDGEYRWQLSRAIPQRDATGKIQMWVGTSTDIQEIKEQEQKKDFFISMASHELKTPITSIKGFVQLLQSTYSNSGDSFLKKSLEVVDKQVLTLIRLISDLLDVSKIKSGSLVLNKTSFEITDMIQEVVTQVQHIHPDYSINILGSAAVVYADRERMGQVLINLLNNAVKYSPACKDVFVKSVIENDWVVVSVHDTGIGISKADQEKIFERFYRVEGKDESTYPGFGIGLFICSEIIQRHQGKISVTSQPGKGSVFSFAIPLK